MAKRQVRLERRRVTPAGNALNSDVCLVKKLEIIGRRFRFCTKCCVLLYKYFRLPSFCEAGLCVRNANAVPKVKWNHLLSPSHQRSLSRRQFVCPSAV